MKIILQEQKQEYKHLTQSFSTTRQKTTLAHKHMHTHTDKQTPNKRRWNKQREFQLSSSSFVLKRAPSQHSKLNRNQRTINKESHFFPTPESYQELLEDQRKPTTTYVNSVCVKRLYASCKKDLQSRWHAQSQGTLIPHYNILVQQIRKNLHIVQPMQKTRY